MSKPKMRARLASLSFSEKIKILEKLRDRSEAIAAAGLRRQAAKGGLVFEYAGDDGDRILAWFRERLRAVGSCLSTKHPEAVLTLVYSGIDAFGLLAADPNVNQASSETFKDWCTRYLAPRIQSIEGRPLTAADLWAARCGILHTSTPVSTRSRNGEAHEIWYQFQGKAGVNLIADAKLEPLILEVEKLALGFKEAGVAFIADINNNPARRQQADSRAQHLLRWGIAHIEGSTAPILE
jgi:hypothetical protein